MKIKSLPFLCLLCLSALSKAQADFRPGYIITASLDTVFGGIDSRNAVFMGQVCRMKTDKGEIKLFSPSDIFGYRITDGTYYVSREINSQKIFLEVLVKGKVGIYFSRDENGDHYYIDKDDMPLRELSYTRGVTNKDGKQVYIESKSHIAILNFYMQDAPQLRSEIYNLGQPDRHNLIKLAEDYQNIVNKDESPVFYEKRLPLAKLSVEPFWGYIKYRNHEKAVSEMGGNIYIRASGTNDRLYFKSGLNYHRLSEEDVPYRIFKIPVQLQYIYPAYRLKPKAGLGFNIILIRGIDHAYNNMAHTLSFNAGFNYSISNTISFSTSFSSDFTPLLTPQSDFFITKGYKLGVISSSLDVGLYIEL